MNTTYGQRLKSARTAAGLSQPKLAELAKVSQNHISDLERDKHFGSVATARFAHYLGVHAIWLDQNIGPRELGPMERLANQILSLPPAARDALLMVIEPLFAATLPPDVKGAPGREDDDMGMLFAPDSTPTTAPDESKNNVSKKSLPHE